MKDFKLNLGSLGYVLGELTRLVTGNPNKSYRIKIVGWRDARSKSQNALFHKWCNELSIYLIKSGRKTNDFKFCKRLLKSTFLGYEHIEYTNALTGEVTIKEELRHTSELDVGEMHQFMNECYHWCFSIGLVLPIPDDCIYRDLMDKQNK